ncbi:Sorbose reductase SOU1 [Fusarium odoratissimum]|uniref:Sorbose reductase SOU1 n=1 Tax=Fusarium oxysporum f. sp. cubense (strain race 4) TaxID=2502994 RepID=N1S920_FUSC4|nr:Sorbose reductase SOU1 [Fusarium odoratissimum]
MGFSELAIYTLGLACIARSIMAFTNPQAEYALNGLKHTATSKDDPSSAPIYMLGTWEVSVGILLLVHQVNGNSTGVTTLAGAAVRHLAASLAVEWAHAGIRVNCISPGYMLTALTQKILNDNPDLEKTWTSLIPQGRMGQPQDLMGPVTFLLSDASSYMTGSDLRVDGGYTVT